MLSYFWSSEAPYRDPFEMFADAAEIIRDEARELAALGCEYIQIDAPELVTLGDPTQREYFAALGIDPDRMLDERGYEQISRRVFPRATRFDAFVLEYDSPRAGTFEALADVLPA
jgi:5-methyltetrahydropteroyltriglutamate--homocysteine methyltransferase